MFEFNCRKFYSPEKGYGNSKAAQANKPMIVFSEKILLTYFYRSCSPSTLIEGWLSWATRYRISNYLHFPCITKTINKTGIRLRPAPRGSPHRAVPARGLDDGMQIFLY